MSARTSPKLTTPADAVMAWPARGGAANAASPAANGMISRNAATTLMAHPRSLVRSAVDSDWARP
jgi:hypothetical protein